MPTTEPLAAEPSTTEVSTPVQAGPALPVAAYDDWLPALAPLARATGATVSVNLGWDLDWERERVTGATGPHLSVRVHDDEVMVGPLWVPGTTSGCAACAEVRERTVLDHPLVGDLTQSTRVPASPGARPTR